MPQTGLPTDSAMLLSYINTMLRDYYSNLDVLCDDLNVDRNEICSKLAELDYCYDEALNRFV
jgi:hypothetical protein